MSETEKRRPGRPATGHAPRLSIRLPEDERLAMTAAMRDGETPTDFVRAAILAEIERRSGGD
jgi:hypothetical protein